MVRAATPGEAAAIARVHVASWRSTYAGILPASYLQAMRVDDYTVRWSRILKDPATRNPVFVAEEAGHVVGFASGGRERDGDRRYLGELYAIYLMQEAQGRGHGRELVARVAQALVALGLTSMLIWVLRDNAPARAFYQHLGGVYVRERELDFGSGFSVPEVGYGWDEVRGSLVSSG